MPRPPHRGSLAVYYLYGQWRHVAYDTAVHAKMLKECLTFIRFVSLVLICAAICRPAAISGEGFGRHRFLFFSLRERPMLITAIMLAAVQSATAHVARRTPIPVVGRQPVARRKTWATVRTSMLAPPRARITCQFDGGGPGGFDANRNQGGGPQDGFDSNRN